MTGKCSLTTILIKHRPCLSHLVGNAVGSTEFKELGRGDICSVPNM